MSAPAPSATRPGAALERLSLAATGVLTIAFVALVFRRALLGGNAPAIGLQAAAVLLMLWARAVMGSRSFHAGAAPTAGGLMTRGPYRFVRHPIYAATLLILWSGVGTHVSATNLALAVVATTCVLVRVAAEERLVCARYPEYADYARHTRRFVPFVVALALAASAAPARPAPVDSTTAAALLRANALPLRLAGDSLTGAGAARLVAEAAASRFTLIGEDHGIAEMPRLCAALFRRLHPLGYRHAAIEIGPLTARIVSRLALAPDPAVAFAAFDAAHPWAWPFVNWREEAAWVTTVVRTAHGSPDALWGLDQEFLESPRIHLERLRALARTPGAQALVDSCLAAARAGYEASTARQDLQRIWLLAANDTTFDRLARAFPAGEGRRIVDGLRRSSAIYRRYFGGDVYGNNLDRSRLLKRHLGGYLQAAAAAGERAPRALFKFGATHGMRGRTLVDTYDIGSTLHELAELEGGTAFNVCVQVERGTQNAYRPYGAAPADTAAAIDASRYELWSAAIGQAVDDSAGDWQLVDLRPLRRELSNRGSAGVARALERLAWSYDALLVVPEGHAAHLFHGPGASAAR